MGYAVDDLHGYKAADLHRVVSDAFADYVIPLRTDAASLDALLSRRGWEPAWSFGLFDADRLVGFWLTGRDDSRNEASASSPESSPRRAAAAELRPCSPVCWLPRVRGRIGWR
jgi:hypothetical protein